MPFRALLTLALICLPSIAYAQFQASHGTCPGGDGGNIASWQGPAGDTFATCIDFPLGLGGACSLAWEMLYDPTCFVPRSANETAGTNLMLNQGGALNLQVFPDVAPQGYGACPSCTHALIVEAADLDADDANRPLENRDDNGELLSNFNSDGYAPIWIEWEVVEGCAFTWGTRKVVLGTGFQASRWDTSAPPIATCEIDTTFSQAPETIDDVYLWLWDRDGDPDPDGDGIATPNDNCGGHYNPLQLDSDLDGCGNVCDCDFNQTGFCDAADFQIFGANQNQPVPPAPADVDMDGSGFVDLSDWLLFAPNFNWPPGPSGTKSVAFGCTP